MAQAAMTAPGLGSTLRSNKNAHSLLAFLQLRPYLTRSLELISCNLSNYDLPYLHIFASFVRDILDTYSSHRFEEQRASERTRAR